MTSTNIKNWKVNCQRCATCPFNADGDAKLQTTIITQIIEEEVSQICHHPTLKGKPSTHLCRGARDIQIKIFYALGWLSEPTDKAWDELRKQWNC